MTIGKDFSVRRVEEQVNSVLREALANQVKTSYGVNVPPSSSIDDRIAMVLELMVSSSIRSVSVESAAAVLNISSSRLRHLFKEQVGIPFHKYEIMMRLERVRLLLRTTDCSVKEAARMLGFVDMSNFSHMFKRTYGVTPGSVKAMKSQDGAQGK